MAKRSIRERTLRASTKQSFAEQLVATVAVIFAPGENGTQTSAGDCPGEHRQFARVSLSVEIDLSSDSHFFSGLSGDLSEGGVFVSTYRKIDIGTAVEVEFKLPGGRVATRGVVRWRRDASDRTTPGVGIAFETLSEAQKRLIHEFCRQREPLYYDLEVLTE